MKTACDICGGKCCVGIIEVFPYDEVFTDRSLTTISLLEDERVMQTKPGGQCIALIDGKCSIYDKRPMICRRFLLDSPCCKSFQEGRIRVHICNPCDLAEGIRKNKSKIPLDIDTGI